MKKYLILAVILLLPFLAYAYVRRKRNLIGKLPSNGSYPTRDKSDISFLVVHHTATPSTTTPEQIANFHLDRGWAGIGYHYLVYSNGTVYEVNSDETISNHVQGNNTASIGIALVGDFDKSEPTRAQYRATKNLLNKLKRKYPGTIVKKHNDFKATACPGSLINFQKLL